MKPKGHRPHVMCLCCSYSTKISQTDSIAKLLHTGGWLEYVHTSTSEVFYVRIIRRRLWRRNLSAVFSSTQALTSRCHHVVNDWGFTAEEVQRGVCRRSPAVMSSPAQEEEENEEEEIADRGEEEEERVCTVVGAQSASRHAMAHLGPLLLSPCAAVLWWELHCCCCQKHWGPHAHTHARTNQHKCHCHHGWLRSQAELRLATGCWLEICVRDEPGDAPRRTGVQRELQRVRHREEGPEPVQRWVLDVGGFGDSIQSHSPTQQSDQGRTKLTSLEYNDAK